MLTDLLERAPREVDVQAGPNRVLLRLDHERSAPIRVHRDPIALAGMMLGALFGWIAIWLGAIVAVGPYVAGAGAIALSVVATLIFVAPFVYVALPRSGTAIEIELLPGELRIDAWRCPLRDLVEVRYVEMRIPSKRDGAPPTVQHSVDLTVGDEQWRLIPAAGQPVAQWLGEVLEAARAGAADDTGSPPQELVDLVDGGRS